MLGFLKRKAPGPYIAKFEVQGISIDVAPDQTLLQAALAAGLPYPNNCRVGSCKTCLCRLVDGKIKQLTDTSYVLNASERRAGAILACQTRLLSDARIEIKWPAPDATKTPIDGTIISVRPLTADIVELMINLAAPISYIAGQYAQISLPSLGITRSYSFAGAPDDKPQSQLRFFVRHVPGGAFTDWLTTERVGERLQLEGPFGGFMLSPSPAPLLFIAGGSGLAPIKAILEQAKREGCRRDATFLFGARTAQDLYALEEISSIASGWAGRFQFVPVLSEEPADSSWAGARGMVTDDLAVRITDLHIHEAYLCGPPPMVDAAVAALQACGVAKNAIRTDSFSINGEQLPSNPLGQ